MNQLAEALTKAGVKTPEQRLTEIALDALVANADKSDYTVQATEQIWAKVQKDAALLVALFNPYGEYHSAIGRLLHRLKHDIAVKDQQKAIQGRKERAALKIVNLEREQQRREEAEQRAIDREEQARRDREYQEYLASWHKTPLFDIKIGEQHVWDVSAGTIRQWLPTQRKKLRALEMLIEGVPEDGRPISYYRTPDDVREIWRILGEDQ